MAGKGRPIGPRDEMGGRELEAPAIGEYEKGIGTPHGTTTYAPKFQDPPAPPPNTRGMSQSDIDSYKRANPKLYSKGGMARMGSYTTPKMGSYTMPKMAGAGKLTKSWSK